MQWLKTDSGENRKIDSHKMSRSDDVSLTLWQCKKIQESYCKALKVKYKSPQKIFFKYSIQNFSNFFLHKK